MKARYRAVVLLWLAAGSIGISGCGNKFFDPGGQVGRYRPTPAVNIILDSLGVAEEPPVAWEAGEDPRPEDTVAEASDFSLGPGDLLRVGIFELYNDGQWITEDYVVNETGNVSLPEAGVINVLGLTEIDLERAIKQKLSAILLDQPVRVTLLRSQRRTCSVLGEGVLSNGRQEIPRHDYRLTDALAAAGGSRQYNVSYVYVSRKQTPSPATPRMRAPEETQSPPALKPLDTLGPGMQEITPKPTASNSEYLRRRFNQPFNQERRMLGMATPSMERLWATSEKVLGSGTPGAWRLGQQQPVIMGSEFKDLAQAGPDTLSTVAPAPSPFDPAKDNLNAQLDEGAGTEIDWIFEDGRWKPVSRQPSRPVETRREPTPAGPQPLSRPNTMLEQSGKVDWVFEDGKWLPVPVGGEPEPVRPSRDLAQEKGIVPLDGSASPADQGWKETTRSRLIKIPIDRLLAGDDRYNIVVKAGDTIHVPVDKLGEFYIDGNVNQRGVIPITGRYMTLKQAIAAAGGLGPLAYPKKCEVVRRIGRDREEIVLVDLDKISSGEQPDFYIKKDDLIRVGTHFSSRWRAVLRNAFRAAYGFGFVYDRNFADADYGSGWPSWL
jgi:polysaccharide biosynthesis/export protein